MRFMIQDNAPYLISGGRAYPVELTEDKAVKIDKENAFETDKIGHLSINEVVAKIGYTKKRESHEEEPEHKEAQPGDIHDKEDKPTEAKRGRKPKRLPKE